METVNLDHNATTPVHPLVLEEMTRVGRDCPGNPESGHSAGRAARALREDARERIAAALGAEPAGICFTSGGTEANNLALHGVMRTAPTGRNHLIASAVEHAAVLKPAAALAEAGVELTVVRPGSDGRVRAADFEGAFTNRTRLASMMLANHETGALQPVAEVAAAARRRGILVHSDAAQAVGKVRVDIRCLEADLVSVSAHKLRGPKGIGLLYVRPGLELSPLLLGGEQEGGLRPGTTPLPLVAGFALALETAVREQDMYAKRTGRLAQRLLDGLAGVPAPPTLNGPREDRLPNTLNLEFPGVSAVALHMALDRAGFLVSTGSACASGSALPSPVLLAMGRSRKQASSSLRISLGIDSCESEIDRFLEVMGRLTGLLAGTG